MTQFLGRKTVRSVFKNVGKLSKAFEQELAKMIAIFSISGRVNEFTTKMAIHTHAKRMKLNIFAFGWVVTYHLQAFLLR